MACAECKTLLSGHCHVGFDKRKGLQFSRTILALEEGVKQSCEICLSILNSVFKIHREVPLVGSKNRNVVKLDLLLQYEYKLGSTLYCNIKGDYVGSVGFTLARYDGQSRTSLASRYVPAATTTFCEETCQLVLQWLNNCDMDHMYHHACQRQNNKVRPTRLIDLGVSPQSVITHSIRLCSPARDDIQGRYVTLSHSWGKRNIFTLTSTNLEELFQNIPYERLSKVFKDAMTVTRKLGVRYLWIDSLCIIQSGAGSAEDWDFEARHMGDVYANAYCNIGASDAMDDSSGLFYRQDHINLMPTVDITLEGVEASYIFIPDDYAAKAIASYPLLDRAWVYQERMLCARMLHFGKGQIFWECNSTTQSERTLTAHCGHGTNTKRTPLAVFGKRLVWMGEIVQSYAGCGLTVDSDIFPALNGVAIEHATIFRESTDKYLAGLWLGDMPHALAWYVNPYHRLMKASPSPSRPAQYRSPSWSWASMNRPVKYRGLSMDNVLTTGRVSCRSCVDIIKTEIGLKTSNLYGSVEHASISLLGLLLVLSRSLPDTENIVAGSFKLLDAKGEDIGSYYPDEFPDSNESRQIICLVLLEEDRETSSTTVAFKNFQGITLEKFPNQDAYQRTGYFESASRHDYLDLLAATLDKQVITII